MSIEEGMDLKMNEEINSTEIVVIDPQPEIAKPRSLKVIAKDIIRCRSHVEHNAVKIGELLNEAKLILVKHGEWEQ
jgi:hypothetical protein